MRSSSWDGWLPRRWTPAVVVTASLLLGAYGAAVAIDANTATAVAAGLALIGAALTLRHADATARRARTADYGARWDHPDFFASRVAAARFLEADESDYDRRWQ